MPGVVSQCEAVSSLLTHGVVLRVTPALVHAAYAGQIPDGLAVKVSIVPVSDGVFHMSSPPPGLPFRMSFVLSPDACALLQRCVHAELETTLAHTLECLGGPAVVSRCEVIQIWSGQLMLFDPEDTLAPVCVGSNRIDAPLALPLMPPSHRHSVDR